MKTLTLAFLCAVCALTVSAQPSNLAEVQKETEEIDKNIETESIGSTKIKSLEFKYDKFDEETTITANDLTDVLTLCRVKRNKQGKLRYSIIFTSDPAAKSTSTPPNWKDIDSAKVIADDKRFSLTGGMQLRYLLLFSTTEKVYEDLFLAKVIDIKIGTKEYTIDPQMIKSCATVQRLAKSLKD